MCTLSWYHTDLSYELVFNRDERRSRGPEIAAASDARDGVRFLAPRDGDFGGTWVTVNEYGVALCLLNAYVSSLGPKRVQQRSRGLLLPSLAVAASAREALRRARTSELQHYPPFFLAAFEPGEVAHVARWDGVDLVDVADAEAPLVSSSVDAERVRRHRRALHETLVTEAGGPSTAVLRAFHASHAGGPSELSPCMHREDAETKSSCRIAVTEESVLFEHTLGPPCSTQPLPALLLARRSPVPAATRSARS